MEILLQLLDILLHINQYLTVLVENHGTLVYGVIALIIFCEVGLVVAPFLPGDSMLFVIGASCATGVMDISTVLILFPAAAIAGDNFNRLMGICFGDRAFRGKSGRVFNQKNLDRSRRFFVKYGARAVTLCRFIPFLRTFVPFVAGMSGMRWRTFFPWSVLGGAGWVVVCVLAGYFFGNLEFIQGHFELVLLTIIGISALPLAAEYLKKVRLQKTAAASPQEQKSAPEGGVRRGLFARRGLGTCRRTGGRCIRRRLSLASPAAPALRRCGDLAGRG